MNEVREVVEAFDAAKLRGERCAMATVVSVEGSAYRRPGARMLVTETGATTGTISAGCLESDVIERAKGVIRMDRSKVIKYDTASTIEEVAWGLGLGCGGMVLVLIEQLGDSSPYIDALRHSLEARSDALPAVIATVYHSASLQPVSSRAALDIGARLFIDEEGRVIKDKLSDHGAATLEAEVRSRVAAGLTGAAHIEVDGMALGLFIEALCPPVSLVVFGAGADVLPVVELAHELGWRTEVVDLQARPASHSRFALADRVTLVRPEEVAAEVSVAPRSLTLLMSHNYSQDREMLRFLLRSPAGYIGVMGPRRRTERMLEELGASQTLSDRLYAPAGLDIGANGPREIALSIIAEMRAVLEGRCGGMLRGRRGSIHGNSGEGGAGSTSDEQVMCGVAA